ncbi:MAG: hypothetical protein IJ654_03875 [Bacteroidales bacterium]|nr:hypothetical protein [Bacteroidales bacterium]
MPQQQLNVTTYMTDVRDCLRPAAFMEIAQEIATIGAKERHFDDTVTLEAAHAVWVLARMHVRFDRMPVRYQPITLKTWHKGVHSVFFLRDYQVLDPEGQVLVSATSSWVIMEIDQRRMLRPDGLAEIIPADPEHPGHAIESPAGKIVIPRALPLRKVADHPVRYSDVDSNHHVNNTRYTSWAMDCLPDELTFNHSLKEIEINFNREARPGETVGLLHACDGPVHYVEGRVGDNQVFICKLSF